LTVPRHSLTGAGAIARLSRAVAEASVDPGVRVAAFAMGACKDALNPKTP